MLIEIAIRIVVVQAYRSQYIEVSTKGNFNSISQRFKWCIRWWPCKIEKMGNYPTYKIPLIVVMLYSTIEIGVISLIQKLKPNN